MPVPQFPVEEGTTGEALPNVPLGLANEPPSTTAGVVAAVKQGAAGSLMGSAVTWAQGKIGDQTPVSHDAAAQELKSFGYDPNVLPQGTIGRGYLEAIKQQQRSIATNEYVADKAGLVHSTTLLPSIHGLASFAGGAASDAPFFAVAASGAGAALEAGAGITGIGAAALEGEATAGAYDVATKRFGTAQGDNDIGIYDVSRDMAFGFVLGGVTGGKARNAGERNLAANNPGNLKVPGSAAFQKFGSMDEGVAAVDHQLGLYRSRGLNTLQQIIETYAPSKDHNNVAAYVSDVSKRTGIDPHAQLADADMGKVRDAMIIHEQGDGWRAKAEAFGQRGPSDSTLATPDQSKSKLVLSMSDALQDKTWNPTHEAPPANVDIPASPTGATSVLHTPEVVAQLKRMETSPKVEPEEIAQANEDVAQARSMAHDPEAFDAAMKETTDDDGLKKEVEFHDAVSAAVRCAATVGVA